MKTEAFLINLNSADYRVEQYRELIKDPDKRVQQVELFGKAFKKEIDRIISDGWKIELVVPFEIQLWSSMYYSPSIVTSYFVYCTRNS